jgi:hypothetical protein
MEVRVGYEKKKVKSSEDLIKAMDEEGTFFAFEPAMEAELDIMFDMVMKGFSSMMAHYGTP